MWKVCTSSTPCCFFPSLTYPGKYQFLALHSNCPHVDKMVLWYFSQNTVPLYQTHCTSLSTPYSVAFTLLCSDWIHFVRTGLVHLYLFKEPIFHETFPDTPSYNWFLSPLRFLVPYQIAWHDIYLWWLTSLTFRGRVWDHSSISSFNHSFHLSNGNLSQGFPEIDIEDTVVNKADSFPDLLKHDWLVAGEGKNSVNYKGLIQGLQV